MKKSFPAFCTGQVDTFQHKREFGERHCCGRSGIGLRRYDKRAGFESLVVKTVAGPVPEQNFHPVPRAVQKHEQMTRQRTLPNNRFG